ncbi:hypothetical protein ScPMuIL_015380 [Solemya velum]
MTSHVMSIILIMLFEVRLGRLSCHFSIHMKDRWNFQGQTEKRFIRIREHQILYKEPGQSILRLRCEESRGNIFLLRRPRYRHGREGVLCLGFAKVWDPGFAQLESKRSQIEYSILRLNAGTVGGHLMSPQLATRGVVPTIDNTCYDKMGRRMLGSLVRSHRACKFPRKLRRKWNYTYPHAQHITIDSRNLTLQLLNGNKYIFECEKRDRSLYVLRTKDIIPGQLDGIMCLEISRLRSDPHYQYQISRINSGEILDGQLRLVSPVQPFHLYQHCDWIDSPGRPEFLYNIHAGQIDYGGICVIAESQKRARVTFNIPMMMMMNQGDEDEEVIFDQTGLLNNRLKPKASSQWCRRFTNTAFLSGAFFVLGLCIAVPGPTLLDLGDRVHADTKSITWIFSARSIGYLLGSIIGGVMFDYFDKQMLMCITLLLTSVATVSMPWCLTLVVLAVMTSVQGIAMGILDTGGNMFCIHLWGKMSAPYMQTLHFAFGIGAFIAPLLAKPFLAPIPANGSIDIVTGNIPTLTHLPNLISSPIPFTNETLQHRVRRGKTSLAAFNDSTNAIWESNQTDRTTTILTLVATALPKKPEAASDKHLKGEYNDGKHMKEVAKPTGDIENKKVETDSTEKEFNTTTINGDISTNQRNVNFTGSNSSTVAKNPMSSVNMTNVNSSVTIKEKTGSIEANTSVSSGNHDVSEDVIHTDNSEETVNTAISSDASGKSSETVEGENKDGNETGDEEESKDTEETVAMHEADETGKANKTETLNVGKPDDKSGADKQKIDDKSGAEKPVAANNQYNRTVDEFGETSIPKTTVNITETQKKPETVTD